jgi:hypothetical protein
MNIFTHIESQLWLAGIFLFLLLYAGLTVAIVNKKKRSVSAARLATVYMALKVFRLLVFVGIVLTYMLTVKIEIKRFVLAAVVIYFIYLLFDTWFLTYSEKQLKKK